MVKLFPGKRLRKECIALHTTRHRYPLKELRLCSLVENSVDAASHPVDPHMATLQSHAQPTWDNDTIHPIAVQGWSPSIYPMLPILLMAHWLWSLPGVLHSPGVFLLKPPVELSTQDHSTGKPSTREIGNAQPLHTCVNDAAF